MSHKQKTPNVQRPTSNGRKADPHNEISAPGEKLSTRVEFEALLDNIVEAQLDKENLEGKRDAKILKAQQEFSADIEALAKEIEECVGRAEQYATAHRAELLPSELKSAETSFATFGFRMGKPALALINEKWDWDKVVAAIKKKFAPLSSLLIVTKETPNKTAIKSQLPEKDLAKIGTRLDQEDKFFIEPKRDPADPRRLAPTKRNE